MEILLALLIGLALLFLVPIISFIGLYFIGKFFISIINKLSYKFFYKQLSTSWAYLLPCLVFLFCLMLIGGKGSLKYIDPQYYEFKRLCENAKNKKIVYDEELYRIYKTLDNQTSYPKIYYDEKTKKKYTRLDFPNFDTIKHKISERLYGYQNFVQHNNKIFLYYQDYFYRYYGIFLKGDEGAGWYIDFDSRILECKGY